MDFYVRFDDLRDVSEITSQKLSSWREELTSVQEGIQKFVNIDSFQGKTAESVKAYYSEVHTLMMSAVNAALTDFLSKYLLYIDGYYDIDTDIHAKLKLNTLNQAKKDYDESMDNLSSVQSYLKNALDTVSDIFYVGVPGITSLENKHEEAVDIIVKTKEKVPSYEEEILSVEIKQLKELIQNARAYIKEYKNDDRNIVTTYVSGDYMYDENIYALAVSMNTTNEYYQKHQTELEEAISQQEKVYNQLQKEYEEELAKQRADQGVAQIIMGGIAVAVGVAAIVCTAGAATPVVVTAAVTGTCTTIYGVSEIAEGGQHVYYGMNGDPYTSAFNPIRDTVFQGNQEAYNMWGSLNMTVASLCVPVGKSVQGLKGVQAIKAGTVAVTKEITMDAAEDFVSEKISDDIIEHTGTDSATAQTLIKFGTSVVVGEVNEATISKTVDQKIMDPAHTRWESDQNRIDAEATGKGFAGLMDEADAKRYEAGETNQIEVETSEIRRDANASGKGFAGLMDEADAKRMDEWTDSQEKPEKIKQMEADEAKAKAEQKAQEQKRIRDEKRKKVYEDIANYTPKDHREADAYVDIENETQKYEKNMQWRRDVWKSIYDALYPVEG